MSFKDGIINFFKKTKYLWFNTIGIIVFFVVAFYVFDSWMNSYTMHGTSVQVPDLTNVDYEGARMIAEKSNLLVRATDTMYVDTLEPGVVIDHFPRVGSSVKTGRTIYLTLNSMTPLMVKMPKVTNVSLRQATQIIENNGLIVGEITYKPDFADNYVFEQRYKFDTIAPGVEIPKGSSIDLLVGKGGEGVEIVVPSLIGLSWSAITDTLTRHGLSINIIFDSSVKTKDDSLHARVKSQYPSFEENAIMKTSDQIDVWLGIDPIEEAISEILEEN